MVCMPITQRMLILLVTLLSTILSRATHPNLRGDWYLISAFDIKTKHPPIMHFSNNSIQLTYCSIKSANYTLNNTSVHFGKVFSLRVACIGVPPEESVVDQAIESCIRLKFTNNRSLECFNVEGRRVLVLNRRR